MIKDNAEFLNIEEMIPLADGWFAMSRMPNSVRNHMIELGQSCMLQPTGSEIRFNILSGEPVIRLRADRPDFTDGELFWGSFRHARCTITGEETAVTVTKSQNMEMMEKMTKLQRLPYDPHLVRFILPYGPGIQYLRIDGDIEPPRPEQLPAHCALHYGSSITYGSHAHRPTGIWPSRLAQRMGWDLLTLGTGGSAMFEPQIADYIASRQDWTTAVLEIGVNMLGTFEADQFRQRVEYFIETIVNAHPDKMIFCLDILPSARDLKPDNKHRIFRKIVRETVEKQNLLNVVHIDATTLITDLRSLSTDMVHPSPAGQEEIALNLYNHIRKHFPM